MSLALTVIPVPAPTAISLVAAIVPPPVSPAPAVILTPVWSICSLATKPERLSCTISPSFVAMSSALAVIPVPPTTLIVRVDAIVPPPVKPAPAVTLTLE